MRIPQEFWGVRLACVPSARLRLYAERLIAARRVGGGVIITGVPRSGKTSAACSILKAARSLGYTGLYLRVPDLRDAVHSYRPFEEGTTIVDRVRAVDFFALDGWSAEHRDDFYVGDRAVADFVVARGSELRPTIFVTSLKPSGFAGGRLYDSLLRYSPIVEDLVVPWAGEEIQNLNTARTSLLK